MSKKKKSSIPTEAVRAVRSRVEERTRRQHGGDTGRVVPDVSAPGGARADLRIRVEEIATNAVAVRETLPQAFVDHVLEDPVDPPWQAAGDARIDLSVDAEAELVRVRGEGTFLLRHACVRCLRDVDFDLDVVLDLRLAPGLPEVPDEAGVAMGDELDEEGELLDPDEADLVPFDGRVIPLVDLLREQVFLEVPVHPACDTEGARPPEGPCSLDPEGALARERARWEDPRWAGLKALRNRLPPGNGDGTVH